MKSSSLVYNRCETMYKRPSCRDPERTWYHLHTRVKLFWSQPMAPWTSAAAYQCAAPQFMEPWAATKKDLHQCGGDTSSCLGPYPMAACPEFYIGCRLGREIFTLPLCCHRCPRRIMGCDYKSFVILVVWRWHQLLSGTLPNGRLSRVSRRIGRELFTLPSYI